MSKGGFNTGFDFTIGAEGRYSDRSSDRGNWTSGVVGKGTLVGSCWGISAPTLIEWVGQTNASIVTADYMKNLSLATAKMIYKIKYWNYMQCELLNSGVDLMVWDFGVNAGQGRSISMLQQIVEVTVDGLAGPVTVGAANSWNPEVLVHALYGAHDRYYMSLDDQEDINGWLDRQERLHATALKMITATQEVSS